MSSLASCFSLLLLRLFSLLLSLLFSLARRFFFFFALVLRDFLSPSPPTTSSSATASPLCSWPLSSSSSAPPTSVDTESTLSIFRATKFSSMAEPAASSSATSNSGATSAAEKGHGMSKLPPSTALTCAAVAEDRLGTPESAASVATLLSYDDLRGPAPELVGRKGSPDEAIEGAEDSREDSGSSSPMASGCSKLPTPVGRGEPARSPRDGTASDGVGMTIRGLGECDREAAEKGSWVPRSRTLLQGDRFGD
mmetsp:Transcript_9245/g.38016  ORF Transcript_9245/g.38016 Transcript_9245/m.38016 type:complete len:252 (+) Transcript_9245:744-1499(+)